MCAPDRETDATVALFRAGERVAEIQPTRLLGHSSDVILIGPAAFELPEFEFAPLRPSRSWVFDRLAFMPPLTQPHLSSLLGGCA